MATIGISASLSLTGPVNASLSGSKSITQTGADYTVQSQSIGTSAEQLDFAGEIGTLGYLMVKNEDSTNFVELALDSGVSTQKFAKLRAGEFIVFPPSTATLYAKADTSACVVSIVALEL